MSSPVATIGLTYDSTGLQHADLGLFLQIVEGLNTTPDVRGRDVVVPGLAGRIPRNRIADVLRIELRGFVRGDGMTGAAQMADFRDKVQALQVLFDPTRDPANIVADLENGELATIAARPLPGLIINDQALPSLFGLVSVVLESVAPTWTITAGGS